MTDARTPSTLGLRRFARLHVTLSEAILLGEVADGTRRVIPITGGTVNGELRGSVVPGGADWNIARDDGTGSISARYALQLDDGTVVGVLNEGRYDAKRPGPVVTTPVLEAPAGGYGWLNSAAFVGTIVPGEPGSNSVDLDFWIAFETGPDGGATS